jgi:hypothetical protein
LKIGSGNGAGFLGMPEVVGGIQFKIHLDHLVIDSKQLHMDINIPEDLE